MGSEGQDPAFPCHGDLLVRLDEEMAAGRYDQALEVTRQILGDPALPPALQLSMTLKEVRALLGVGKPNEAAGRMCAAIMVMHEHELYDQRAGVEAMLTAVEVARAPDIGGIGI